MSNGIRIEGEDAVIKMLEKCADIEKIKSQMGKACALVERSAKQNAPKGTGELRRSITSKVDMGADGDIKGTIYTPLEYAPYIEYGTGLFAEDVGREDVPWCYKDDKGEWHTTSGQHPHPYMRPALNENRTRIIELLEEGLHND